MHRDRRGSSPGEAVGQIADNVVIKVPILREGLIAVKQLASLGIKTNVTVIHSPLQALLAAKCGATYVSPFVGRLDSVGQMGMEMIHQIRTIFDNYDFATEILVASARHPMHVLEAALAGLICDSGGDVATLLPPDDRRHSTAMTGPRCPRKPTATGDRQGLVAESLSYPLGYSGSIMEKLRVGYACLARLSFDGAYAKTSFNSRSEPAKMDVVVHGPI